MQQIDPLVEKLTIKQLENDITEYLSLIDNKESEAKVHDFLASHSYFFNTILRLYGHSPLYSKLKLGSNHEVDFAFFDTSTYGPEWYFVEIESPKQKMFTKGGDQSAALTHAIRQAQDWIIWVNENKEYARKSFPHITYPLCYIFIGRRKDLNSETSRRLKEINYQNRMNIEVHSLDWFASAASTVKNLLEREKGGTWPIPMRALSHKEFVNGFSEPALSFFNQYKDEKKLKRWQKELLSERETKYMFRLEQND